MDAPTEEMVAQILNQQSVNQKCTQLTNVIKNCLSNNVMKDLVSQYKPIVENIFGINETSGSSHTFANQTGSMGHLSSANTGWQLHSITLSSNSNDYNAIFTFLHPDGVLFTMIKALMMETNTRFEFPISVFPPFLRTLIENGRAPAIFSSKMISTNYTSASHLVLNAFEFYMFSFSFYILIHPTSGDQIDWISPELDRAADSALFFVLLKTYLDQFVPLDQALRLTHSYQGQTQSTNQHSIWHSLSSTTSTILSLATHSNNSNAGSPDNQADKMLPSLFKSSILQLKAPFRINPNQPTQNVNYSMSPSLHHQMSNLGSIEWRCNTVILMFSEIWLASSPGSTIGPQLSSNYNNSLLLEYSVPSPRAIYPFSANANQMRALRLLIKHLHHFANSQNFNHDQRLTEIKHAIWSSKYPIQKSLYRYLRVAFTRWPIDTSFRLPLETWISYIQPWRYTSISSDIDRNNTSLDSSSLSIDWNWRSFIADNLLYYTVIFGQLLQRLSQMDLSTSRNAFMLFRVAKVYSQPGFMKLLREAEENICRMNSEPTKITQKKSPIKASPLQDGNESTGRLLSSSIRENQTPTGLPGLKPRSNPLRHHLVEAETDPDFSYVSLFSSQVKHQVIELLKKVNYSKLRIREYVDSVDSNAKTNNKSWKQSVKSFLLMDDDNFEALDEQRMYKDKIDAERYLSFSADKLATIFEVSPSALTQKLNNQLSEQASTSHDDLERTRSSEFGSPIPIRHRPTSNLYSTPRPDANLSMTSELTPLGRHQLMNRQAKSLGHHEGNPDLRPVCSYEIAIFVTLTIMLSTWINERYADTISEIYSSSGFKGWLGRRLLSPPTCYIEFQKSSTVAPVQVMKALPARVNLRPLASKRAPGIIAFIIFIFYIFL